MDEVHEMLQGCDRRKRFSCGGRHLPRVRRGRHRDRTVTEEAAATTSSDSSSDTEDDEAASVRTSAAASMSGTDDEEAVEKLRWAAT
jgi:hypothetical protein